MVAGVKGISVVISVHTPNGGLRASLEVVIVEFVTRLEGLSNC